MHSRVAGRGMHLGTERHQKALFGAKSPEKFPNSVLGVFAEEVLNGST
jgi:hypothetical protein